MTGTLFSLAALVAGIFLYTACETSSTDDPRGISVSPSSASLAPGQSIVLTAEGGWNYNWGVDKESIGYLTTKSGPTVTYVATATGTQTISVDTKPIAGSSSSTNKTASSSSPSSAIVRITQGGR